MRIRTSLGGAREVLIDNILGSETRYPTLTDEVFGDSGNEVGKTEVEGTDAAILIKCFG